MIFKNPYWNSVTDFEVFTFREIISKAYFMCELKFVKMDSINPLADWRYCITFFSVFFSILNYNWR